MKKLNRLWWVKSSINTSYALHQNMFFFLSFQFSTFQQPVLLVVLLLRLPPNAFCSSRFRGDSHKTSIWLYTHTNKQHDVCILLLHLDCSTENFIFALLALVHTIHTYIMEIICSDINQFVQFVTWNICWRCVWQTWHEDWRIKNTWKL